MYNVRRVTEGIWWIGASDRKIARFENVYPVPAGMSYNSYLIMDGKTCLMDGIDCALTGQFMENLEHVLEGRKLDYMVVQHMEPDHGAVIPLLLTKYPEMTVVCSQKALQLMEQFFGMKPAAVVVKENDTLSLGGRTLSFIAAPMVHWPEVIMTYDSDSGAVFSADAFGSFGALSGNIFADEVDWEKDWSGEARRYYANIVGKYGNMTGAALKKLSAIDLKMILPLHGHIWRRDLNMILDRYEKWASYTPEINSVAIFYGSVYNNTANAADILSVMLAEKGISNVHVYDVSKTDVSELVSAAFEYSTLVFASATYNGEIFDPMHSLAVDLKNHFLSGRNVGIIENGSWGPVAGKKIAEIIGEMKNMTLLEPVVTIKSSLDSDSSEQLNALADAIVNAVCK